MVKVADEKTDRRRGIDHIGVSICAIVHDGQGKILMMKRGQNARDEHGNWDICGGALEFGELVEDAIARELQEELCTAPLEIQFLTAYEAHRLYNGDPTHWIALLHGVKVDPKTVKLGEPDKFDDFGWFRKDELPTPQHSQFPKALAEAFSGCGSPMPQASNKCLFQLV
jgi:8-oxo-dGTP pyrophosphatase MutT (NUDIX family)